MFNDQARISVPDSLHTLLIIVHAKAVHGRGLLLLNASETEARIKHLDGFVSASFFSSKSYDTIGEYVQWRTAAHLGAAFRRPEFHEHLPVVENLAWAEVGFYSVERVITSEDHAAVIGPSFSGTVDLQVLKLPKENIDTVIARMGLWAETMKKSSNSLRTAVVHADRVNAKAALLMHHEAAEVESAWYTDPETSEIDRGGRLMRYTTVSAPGANDRPMRYVMSATGAHKGHGS